jgi:cytochrome c
MHKGFDFNKIFSAFLMAVLVASLSGFISHKLVEAKAPKEKGYAVAVSEHSDAGEAVAEKPKEAEPIDALLAKADVTNGQKLTRACAACHSFDNGGPNRVGPNLWGIVGREHSSAPGFAYSEALKAIKGKWDEAALNKWLYSPKTYAPGNKMSFAGVPKTQDRADLVAYLKTLK